MRCKGVDETFFKHACLFSSAGLVEGTSYMYNSNVIPRVSHSSDGCVFESQSHVCTGHLIFLHHPIFWSKLLVLGRMGAPAPWSSRYVRLLSRCFWYDFRIQKLTLQVILLLRFWWSIEDFSVLKLGHFAARRSFPQSFTKKKNPKQNRRQ